MRILITGGAGFIGLHLARKLLADHHSVTLLDNFSPQVHVDVGVLPVDLCGTVELVVADVRDSSVVNPLLKRHDVLIHLAAETGTGQSMYEVERYSAVNISATAAIFHALANDPQRSIQKVIVASSRSVYGEGRYLCRHHGLLNPESRSVTDMKAGRFELRCPECDGELTVRPTDEDAPFRPSSFYGLTKQMQEQTTLMFAKALGISGIALRYQNVYGPGQALHNPYTGILAIFNGLAKAGKTIEVFEDGNESRDFVYVDDVVAATAAFAKESFSGVSSFNVGSGVATRVIDVAQKISTYHGGRSDVRVTGAFRIGDIRHNVADLSRIQHAIGFSPAFTFSQGLQRFLDWAEGRSTDCSKAYESSIAEMKSKGLLHGH